MSWTCLATGRGGLPTTTRKKNPQPMPVPERAEEKGAQGARAQGGREGPGAEWPLRANRGLQDLAPFLVGMSHRRHRAHGGLVLPDKSRGYAIGFDGCNGDCVCAHQHSRPPSWRHAAQLKHHNPPVMHKTLEDTEDDHSKCQP